MKSPIKKKIPNSFKKENPGWYFNRKVIFNI